MPYHCARCGLRITEETDYCIVCDATLTDCDALFGKAARMLSTRQHVSVGALQEMLDIGYARSGRILDELRQAGLIGEAGRDRQHKVLVSDFGVKDFGID